ncbi:MAG: alpha-amylase family glycosyl hydrolase [Xenococcaceae cyanobacterium MO_234.B1]|nr:alpha-amylase family glycosyl hydrolase [Xenococcaceae cyanobacterium MO_234.B1]
MPRIEDLDLERYSLNSFYDNRVLLQGFYWESYRHGNTPPDPAWPKYGDDKLWYEIVKDNAQEIREGRFDLIWLPPVCFAGDYKEGYTPKEYFNYSNSYGNKVQHREMLEALLSNGIEPIADVVINHRDGTSHWADFTNPEWDLSSVSRNDEFFKYVDSDLDDVPEDYRDSFRPEQLRRVYGNNYKTAPRGNPEPDERGYDAYRDIDHSNPIVRRDILRYLLSLRTLGYRGWRYDLVKGFLADKVSIYNRITTPSFSVGEFWERDNGQLRGWTWHTAVENGNLKTASNIFDFQSYYTLRDSKGNYKALSGYGKGIGLIGDDTDGHSWKNRAVTFLENHDTGYRTKGDGTPQKDHKFDSFANNWEVEQGYAYILTHPGIPSVYWKHYFDWGSELKNKIKALKDKA